MLKGFITNLGKYNEGILQGEWIDFPISEEELEAVYKRIGINEEYEEIFFTDWECDFDTGLGEHENIDDVNELAEALQTVEHYAEESKLESLIEATGCSLQEALERLDNATFYPGYTLEEVAEEIVADCYNLPEFALRYFDYAAFARDLSFDGYTETSNGVIYIN